MYVLLSTMFLSAFIVGTAFGRNTLCYATGWITTVFFRLLLLIVIKIMILLNIPKGFIIRIVEENWTNFIFPLPSSSSSSPFRPFGGLSIVNVKPEERETNINNNNNKNIARDSKDKEFLIDLNQLQVGLIDLGQLHRFRCHEVELDFCIHLFLRSKNQTVLPISPDNEPIPPTAVLNVRIRLSEIRIIFQNIWKIRLFSILRDLRGKGKKDRTAIWGNLLSMIVPNIELSGIDVATKLLSSEEIFSKDQNQLNAVSPLQHYLHSTIDIKKLEVGVSNKCSKKDSDETYDYNRLNSSLQGLTITALLVDTYYSSKNANFSKEFWESKDSRNLNSLVKHQTLIQPTSLSTTNSHKSYYYQIMVQNKNVSLSTFIPYTTKTDVKFNIVLNTIISTMSLSSCDRNEMKELLNNQAVISAQPKLNLFIIVDTVSCEMTFLPSQDKDISIQVNSFSVLELQQLDRPHINQRMNMLEIFDEVKAMNNSSGLYNDEHFYILDRKVFVTIIFQCQNFQVSINTNDELEDILIQKIHVKINSPLQLHWNILLQVLAFSMIYGFSTSLKMFFLNCGATSAKKTLTTIKKKEKVNVLIQSNNPILFNLVIGQNVGSTLDILVQDLLVRVENDNFDSLKKKPNLLGVKISQVQIYAEDFYAPLGTVYSVQFTSIYRLAEKHEIDQYSSYTYDDSCSSSLELCNNKLISNASNIPFLECFQIECKDIIIRIPPDPPFGELIDNIACSAPILIKTIKKIVPEAPKCSKGFQLMKISAKIAHIDASVMELLPPGGNYFPPRVSKGQRHEFRRKFLDSSTGLEDLFLFRLRVLIRNIDLNAKRNAPPSYVQQRLQELDEHPGLKNYGPDVLGGEDVLLTIQRVILVIDPLNLVVPLVDISDIKYKGLLFIAPLISPNANKSKKKIKFPCFHSKEAKKCYGCCGYHTNYISDDIPPKVYFDGSFFFKSARVVFGKEVEIAIPKLVELVKLLQPPTPPSGKPLNMGWWDNLRFWIHGRVQADVSKFEFEWLLDSVEKYNRNIRVTLTRLHLQHSVGYFKLHMSNIVLSIPNRTYSSTIFSSKTEVPFSDMRERMKSYRDLRCHDTEEEVEEDLNDRYSLLFFPMLKIYCCLEWPVSCTHATASSEHHSPYLNHHPEVQKRKKPLDFSCFRSDGVHIRIHVDLLGHAEYANWVILRNDNMPWFTHQPSFTIPPRRQPDEDDPGPIPKIMSLKFKGCARDLRVGLWRNNPLLDKNGLCVIFPSISVKSSSSLVSTILPSSKLNTALHCRHSQSTADNINNLGSLGVTSSSEALISSSTVIELSSAYAALLDVTRPNLEDNLVDNTNTKDYTFYFRESLNCESNDVFKSTNIVPDLDQFFKSDLLETEKDDNWYDRIAGLLGASEDEIFDALDSYSNSSDAPTDRNSNPLQHHCDFSSYDEGDNKTCSEFDNFFTISQNINEASLDYYDRMTGLLGATDDENHQKMSKFATDQSDSKKSESDIFDSDDVDGHLNVFKVIQRADISDLDYLVEMNKVVILDRSQDDILSSDTSDNIKGNISNVIVPWTCIVSGMKLLWTLEIRNVILLLIGDLLETINFMTLQLKENQPQLTQNDIAEGNITTEKNKMNVHGKIDINADEAPTSKLEYLLSNQSPVFVSHVTTKQPFATPEVMNSTSKAKINGKEEIEQTSPAFNIFFSNPQIQLNSKATGGSIIFAINGAYVEGRKGKKLIQTAAEFDSNDISCASIDDFLSRIDFECTLEKVEAYAVTTDVDVEAGLQWLGISRGAHGYNKDREYDLSKCDDDDDHLDYLSYVQSLLTTNPFIPPLLFRKMLDPCTIRTKNTFYHPPIHLSNDELISIITMDGVLKQNSKINILVTDQKEIQVDELSFMLDSHQLSTTIDLIRNLFLAPPPSSLPDSSTEIKSEQDDNINLDNTDYEFSDSVQHDENTNQTGDSRWGNFLKKKNTTSEQSETTTSDTSDNNGDVSTSMTDTSTTSTNLNNKNSLLESLLQEKGATINKKARNNLKQASAELMNSLEKDHALGGSRVIRKIKWRLGKAKWNIRSDKCIDDVVIDLTELCGQHEFSADGALKSTIDLENLHVLTLKPSPLSMLFNDATLVLGTSLAVSEMSPCRRCGVVFSRENNQSISCRFHADRFGNPRTYDTSIHKWTCCGAALLEAPGCVSRPHTGEERVVSIRIETCPRSTEKLSLYKHVEVNIYPNVPYKLIVQFTKNIADLFMDYFLEERGPDPTAADHIIRKNSADASLCKSDPFNDANQPDVAESEIFFIKLLRIGNISVDISALGFPMIPDTQGLIIQVPAFSKVYKIGTVNYLGSKYLSYLIHEVIKSATSGGIGILRDRFVNQQPEQTNTDVEYRATEEFAQLESNNVEPAKNGASSSVSKEEKEFVKKANLLLGNGHLRKNIFRK